jgi:hypothetical protein
MFDCIHFHSFLYSWFPPDKMVLLFTGKPGIQETIESFSPTCAFLIGILNLL